MILVIQNTDDNPNIQYEKRIGETFIRSHRMNLLRAAEFIANRNWDKVPLPKGNWQGSNDHDNKTLDIAWKGKTVHPLLRFPSQQDTLTYEGEKSYKSRESAKTVYASYEKYDRDVSIINVEDMLCETIKPVNKEHIGAFYRGAIGKFDIALKEVELKDL